MGLLSKNLLPGSTTFVVGLLLWLFADEIQVPIFALTKVGVVLMALGTLEFCYGLYLAMTGPSTARRRDLPEATGSVRHRAGAAPPLVAAGRRRRGSSGRD